MGPYIYRGTTVGWPGNEVLRDQRLTCAATDPVVATLFAIECQRHGQAVLHLASFATLRDLIAADNHFPGVECAINFMLSPDEFIAHVQLTVDAQTARDVLAKMGLELPVVIADRQALRRAIFESQTAGQRLSEMQIRDFNERLFEVAT